MTKLNLSLRITGPVNYILFAALIVSLILAIMGNISYLWVFVPFGAPTTFMIGMLFLKMLFGVH